MRGKQGGASANPFLPQNQGRKRKQAKPSVLDKQATVFAAEQNLKPYELPKPKSTRAKPPAPAPISENNPRLKSSATPIAPKPKKKVSAERRYRAAVAAPVVPRERQLLARTLTPKRRAQYQQIITPPTPARDTSLLHALLTTPGSVAHGLGFSGHLARETLKATTGADVNRLIHPLAAIQHDQALEHERQQWFKAHPNASPASLPKHLQTRLEFPFAGPLKGAFGGSSGGGILGAVGQLLGRTPKQTLVERVLEHTRMPDELRPGLPRPGLRPGVDVPRTPQGELVASLPEVNRANRDVNALRSQELGVRTREAQRRYVAARAEGLSYEEAAKIRDAALSGAMPTLRWGKFTEMTNQAFDDMVYKVETHPEFQGEDRFFKRKNTIDALARIRSGYYPRDFEVKLLREAFGEETTQDLVASVEFWKKNSNRLLNVIGIPRSLLASFDLSAPLRQNLVFATSHPVLWARNFKPMIKAFGSTAVQDQVMLSIFKDPNYDLMRRAGIRFTDLGHDILKREEGFQSSYAEAITGDAEIFKKFTGGRNISPVSASNRAYVTFNNKSRADLFNHLLNTAERLRPELDWESADGDKLLKEFGRLVNNATGRGKFPTKALEKSMPVFNALLFSPRLLASRLDVLSYPATIWTMDPISRREAIKQLGSLISMVGAVTSLAAIAGAKVSHDPRNADFGKVRIGNTRFDIAGGFLQPVRLAAQLGPDKIGPVHLGGGRIISSTTGKEINLGGHKFGGKNRFDIFLRFWRSKASPPASFLWDWSSGTDFSSRPFSFKREMYEKTVPLLAQDAKDFYAQGNNDAGNAALAMAIYGIGMWGLGTQTYGTKKPKPHGPTISSGYTQDETGFGTPQPTDTGGGYFGSSQSDSSTNYFAPGG